MTDKYCVDCDTFFDDNEIATHYEEHPDEKDMCPECGSYEPLIDAEDA